MLGAHLSIAGGLVNALHAARRLKMDCVQVFTANQRQWAVKRPSPSNINDWQAALQEMRWDVSPPRVVSHNSYLINLASPDPTLWNKSVEAMREELVRCESLQIRLCVTHPGAHLGAPRPKGESRHSEAFSRDELAGMKRIIRALDRIHRDLPGLNMITCLETTVGSGTNLGYRFEQLHFIRGGVRQPERVGYCFDTCHVTAAGYDMSSAAKASAVLQQFDEACGFDHIRAFHFNDSVGALGSRLDRHAHIGCGCCGIACFRTILNHPAFTAVPKLLETPKGLNEKQIEWDLVNLRRLRRMMTKRPNRADKHRAAVKM